MTKYKITITEGYPEEVFIYFRESKFDNFFTALSNDLLDIDFIIQSEDCIEYDWEVIK